MKKVLALLVASLLVLSAGCLKNISSEQPRVGNVQVLGNYSNAQVLVKVSVPGADSVVALRAIMEWSEEHGCKVVDITGQAYNTQHVFYAVLDCGGAGG